MWRAATRSQCCLQGLRHDRVVHCTAAPPPAPSARTGILEAECFLWLLHPSTSSAAHAPSCAASAAGRSAAANCKRVRAGLGGAAFSGCYIYALRYTSLADAFLLTNGHSIAFLLAAAAREFSVEPLKLVGTVVCTAGAWLTTFDPGEAGQSAKPPQVRVWACFCYIIPAYDGGVPVVEPLPM